MGFLKISPLTIGVLSLFLNFVDNVDIRSNASLGFDTSEKAFSNRDQKTNEDQRYWYEHLDDADRTLKSKTDILSRLLKMHIDQLRNQTDHVSRDRVYLILALFFDEEKERKKKLSDEKHIRY